MAGPPVVLVHGMASSFDHGWRDTGWVDILGMSDREVVGLQLPGHGPDGNRAPMLDEPFAGTLIAAIEPYGQVDAVGFSAGSRSLLEVATMRPELFRRLALIGLGDLSIWFDRDEALALADRIAANDPLDINAGVYRRSAASSGTGTDALVQFIRRDYQPLSEEDVSRATCQILLVIGDQDYLGPTDRLMARLPNARLVTIRGLDHFAAPSDFQVIDVVTRFLAEA